MEIAKRVSGFELLCTLSKNFGVELWPVHRILINMNSKVCHRFQEQLYIFIHSFFIPFIHPISCSLVSLNFTSIVVFFSMICLHELTLRMFLCLKEQSLFLEHFISSRIDSFVLLVVHIVLLITI